MSELLTRHNPHFNRATNELVGEDSSSPESQQDEPAYVQYLRQSLAASTQAQYLIDRQDFEAWGGLLPANPEAIASYVAQRAETLAVATLVRRLAALSKLHDAYGFANPVRTELVKATMRGIKRSKGVAQREAAPLMKEDLFSILGKLGDKSKDLRDKALLLIGFAAALRRSEIVGLNVQDVQFVRQGIVINIKHSKTDQEAAGRQIGIPFGRSRWCAVKAVEEWLAHAANTEGPIFRLINRHGHIFPQPMKPEAVFIVVRERVTSIGLNPNLYSGHSLRAGLASSAAEAGVASWAIRRTTGHRSDQMLNRYIRLGDLFQHNAAGAVL
jgi:integrase